MPSGQVTRNCHYISKSLTRPWEADQRRLLFYDFDTGRFATGYAASLFAADGLNPQHVETWLDRTIEGPLSVCRRKLEAGETDALEEWTFYRAATLMLWLQGTRVRSIGDQDARRDLESLANRPIEETDQLAIAMRQEYDLSLVIGPAREPLLFPSSGLFPITYPDTGCISGNSVALGLPLSTSSALIALPRDQAGVRDVSRIPALISMLSIGVTNARKVVIPPSVLAEHDEAQLARTLVEMREASSRLLAMVNDARHIVDDAFGEVGLIPPRDSTGRIPATR